MGTSVQSELDILFVDPYYSIHCFCKQAMMALIGLHKCAGRSGPVLSAICIRALFVHCTSYDNLRLHANLQHFIYFRNMTDPRLIKCLGVLLGIDLTHMDNTDPSSEPSTTSETSDGTQSESQNNSPPKPSQNSKSSAKQDNDKHQVD